MTTETPTILVIDDEQSIRTTIARVLRGSPYKVIDAVNGQDGLAQLQEMTPNVIILDLMMPEMNGIEFLKQINLQPDDPYAVIILTGHGDDKEMQSCYELGAHFFLRKPFSFTELTCLIKRCLILKNLENDSRLYQNYLEKSVQEQTDYISKLSLALDQSGSAVLMTDSSGRITYANHAYTAVTGNTLDDVKGTCPIFLDPERNPGTAKIIWEDLARKGSWKGEILNARKDDTNYWCFTAIFPVRDANGEVQNYLIIKDDITTIKEAQEEKTKARQETDEARKIRAEFSNNISHELLTPLHIITSSTALLESKELTSVQQKYVAFIKQSASDLNNLLDTLLHLKFEQGDLIPIRQQPFSLHEVLDDLTALHKNNIVKKNIDIFFSIDKELPETVVGDELRIRQILSYLLSNALKFTKKGHVSLTASLHRMRADDNRMDVAFEVADTGIGIPHDRIDHIFDPFLQGDGSNAREFGGLGIGLTLVKSLVTSLKGDIQVDSVVNNGSIFTVIVPLAKPESN